MDLEHYAKTEAEEEAMKTTVLDLVRAALLYASTHKNTHLKLQRGIDLGAAADALDTSGEVVLSRGHVEVLLAGPGHDLYAGTAEYVRRVLKEQS